MKTKMKSGPLARVASLAASVAARDPLSMFSRVALSATKNYLHITGGDGTCQVSARLDAESNEDWNAAVPAALFAKFAGALPDGDLQLTASESKLSLDCCGVRFGLSAFEAAAAMAAPKDCDSLAVDSAVLYAMLERTAFAACEDETRKACVGVHVKKESGMLMAVAMDGRRLAYAEFGGVDAGVAAFAETLPQKTVDLLIKLLSKTDGEVSIRTKGHAFMVTGPDWCVTSVTNANKYPEWRRVVPKDLPHRARIGRADFVAALKRAALSSFDSDAVAISLADGKASFGARSEVSSAGQDIAACHIDGGAVFAASFQPQYLLEPLEVVDDEEIEVFFSDEQYVPIMIKSTVSPWFCVVMPLRKK